MVVGRPARRNDKGFQRVGGGIGREYHADGTGCSPKVRTAAVRPAARPRRAVAGGPPAAQFEQPAGDQVVAAVAGRGVPAADGRPLPTEFFGRDPTTDRQQHQGHHEVITSPDQVQVNETLLRDAKGNFTTSFVRGCETVKDNRLLPRGWKADGPGPALAGKFLQATAKDPCTRTAAGRTR